MVPVGHYAPDVPIDKILDRLSEYQKTALNGISDEEIRDALFSRYQSTAGHIASLTYLEIRGKLKPKPKRGGNALFPVALIIAAIDEMHLALGGSALPPSSQ
jgi:hypothetical protein